MSPKTTSNFHASWINEYFFEALNLIPSTELSSGSIVYGKITQTSLANNLEHFSGFRIFLFPKISDMCSHLSLGARYLTQAYATGTWTAFGRGFLIFGKSRSEWKNARAYNSYFEHFFSFRPRFLEASSERCPHHKHGSWLQVVFVLLQF